MNPTPTPDDTPLALDRLLHKALNSALLDTLVQLGATDAGDAAERAAAADALARLLRLLRDHVHHENDFLHTAIEARQPGGSAPVAAQHAEQGEAMSALDERGAALQRRPGGAAAAALYRELGQFAARQLRHMAEEEQTYRRLLGALYDRAEWRPIEARLLAAPTPDEWAALAPVLERALSPQERALLHERRLAAGPG
ncbi:MAG: hemerythrin domain-containing protein [Rubrivivax sp.]|nr:hemerythrin domain-containing protein [Rubrivivax sp.]